VSGSRFGGLCLQVDASSGHDARTLPRAVGSGRKNRCAL